MSLHRFSASRPLVQQVTTTHGNNFGVGAAVLCPVMTTATGLAVDYDRAASAKAQLQAMLAAIARHDAMSAQNPDEIAAPVRFDTTGDSRPLPN
jgi:Flp pilus assembly protein TadG